MLKICTADNCNRYAHFEFTLCFKHKLNSNIIGTKYCIYKDCTEIAYYGFGNPVFCKQHNLINLKKKHNCNICSNIGTYKYAFSDILFCNKHANKHMVNYSNVLCKTINCNRYCVDNYADMCNYCCGNTYNNIRRNGKIVSDLIITEFNIKVNCLNPLNTNLDLILSFTHKKLYFVCIEDDYHIYNTEYYIKKSKSYKDLYIVEKPYTVLFINLIRTYDIINIIYRLIKILDSPKNKDYYVIM